LSFEHLSELGKMVNYEFGMVLSICLDKIVFF